MEKHEMKTNNLPEVIKMEKKEAYDKTATLDEAMFATGFGVYNILHMLLSGLILMGVIMQSLALGYVLPAAQCDLDLTLQQRGWLAAIPFSAIILTSYFWGWLADTRGRRFVMLFSMLISTVFAVLASFSPEIISFAVLSFTSAVFMAGPSSVVYTYLGEFTNLRHRDKIVAFGSSFVGIGTIVLPAVSWLILSIDIALPINFLNITYRSWRLLVIAANLPLAIGFVLLLFAPESPKFLNASGQQDACLRVLRQMYAVNKRLPEKNYPIKSLVEEAHTVKALENSGLTAVFKSMKDQTLPLFQVPLLKWTLLICFIQFGLFGTTNGYYVWFPTILNSVANHDGEAAGICAILDAHQKSPGNGTDVACDDTMNTTTFELSIYIGLVFSSMYIIVGFLVDFMGKKLILLLVLSSTGLCGIGAHLAPNQNIAVVLFAIFQMCGACIGLTNAVTVELFPTKYRAMAICLSMMMGRVGSMAGSNLIGMFLSTNCGLSFYIFGGLILSCALLCFTLPGKSDSAPKEIKTDPTRNQTHEPA
ncbi:synaptic vesicle glycoprotein 2B-like isoform X1 [Pieris rapae]|uniref:synaptic vesicle glycoprotein 2B-like isoform X1 n=1 Tax=Pieris rapae TaxID=64459 RepID=UPI001E27C321|nr:synaptic vesicle glycoprotein 2B-like isoform X1 [Pieris rapae]